MPMRQQTTSSNTGNTREPAGRWHRRAQAATCALLLSWGSHAMAEDHVAEICLGWTGGAAGTGYKWVSGAITWQGDHGQVPMPGLAPIQGDER